MISSRLNENGLVLNRYFAHIPENLDITGYRNVTSDYMDFIKKESTQLYDIKFYERL